MKINMYLGYAMMFSIFLISSPAYSDQPISPDLGFKLGDDVSIVKSALHTDLTPDPMERNPALPAGALDINKGKSVLHLRTKGIWVFFNTSDKVETIRLDAPYSGSVLGIRLGDSAKQMISKLGNPIKKPSPAFITMLSNQYVIDDSSYAVMQLCSYAVMQLCSYAVMQLCSFRYK